MTNCISPSCNDDSNKQQHVQSRYSLEAGDVSKGRNVLLCDSLQITAIRLQPAFCGFNALPLLRPKYNIFKFSKRPFLIASVKICTNSSAFSAMVGLSTSQVLFSPTEE